ncbi:hypothetical protein CSKR_112312 [Clonorchis sinensis]|uniref:RRM domain-containing protein n=1 Tax=Clonorchis sinensis TaxID=79923 RepID=A0A3R7EVV6_CLOSI|nr:hypothetical protein CSKR_112312 [Clonorchis sinensis]
MTDAEGNEIGKLFVGGLSQATNNGSLRLYFSRFGEVDDAVVMMDNKTGRSRGFGYVKYREPESVTLALEAKPHILDGKEVDAKQCNVNMKGRNRRSLKVFVGGIGLDQDAESIKNYFRQFGRVTDVNLMMDSNKQRHRGFAFVGFEDEAVVKRLISLHYVTMNNKQVEIKAMEPPNFGRKIGATACMAAAAVMAGATTAESGCTHAFEHTADAGGLIANGLTSLTAPGPCGSHSYSYLSTQQNLLGQQRTSPQAAYEHQAGTFGSHLLPETLFQSTAFVPLSPSQYATRSPAEAILPTGSSTNSYITSKQSVPFILANSQLHQSGGTFGPGASLYATIPCQLVPQQLVSHPPHANIGQLINTEKSNLPSWPASGIHPTQLTICSPQVATQTGLVACPQYVPGQPVPQTTAIQTSAQPNPPNASLLAPYYAVCSPYTTIPIQTDQPNSVQLTSGNHNASAPTILAGCGMQSTPSGAGDSAVLQMSSTSRTTSPSNDTKTETTPAANSGPTTKVVYPTVLMTTPSGLQTTQVVPSPNATVTMGQPLWNQTHSSLVYSSLPVGWTVHPTAQATGAQPWHPSMAILSQQLPVTNCATPTQLKSPGSCGTTTDNMQAIVHDSACSTKEHLVEQTQVAPAKASGDSLDGLIVVTERAPDFTVNEEANSTTAYRCIKPQNNTTGRPEGQIADVSGWSLNGGATSRTTDAATWSNSGIASATLPHWNEHTSSSITAPPNVILQPHPWSLPLELIDDATNYDVSSNGGGRSPQDGNCNTNRGTQAPVNSSSQRVTTTKTSTDPMKLDSVTQPGLSTDHPRVTQRLPQYQQTSQQQLTSGQKQTEHSQAQQTNNQIQQAARSNARPAKLQQSLGDSVEARSKLTAGNGPTLPSELSNTRENNNRRDYSTWLYSNSGSTAHLDNSTGGDGKDIRSAASLAVEIECQGPAGAAGDFHRPVHMGHYPAYR